MIDNQHRELLILANPLVELSLASLAQEVTQENQQGELRPSAFYSFIIDDVVIGQMLRDDVLFFLYTAQKLN